MSDEMTNYDAPDTDGRGVQDDEFLAELRSITASLKEHNVLLAAIARRLGAE